MRKNIQDRLEFNKIDEDVKQSLRSIKPWIEKEIPAALDGFYNHISLYPNLAAMFSGRAGMEGASKMQSVHWSRIAAADFSDDYIESVTRIGLRHNKLGLDPKWYIGGYSFIASSLVTKLLESEEGKKGLFGLTKFKDSKETSKKVTAFIKALLLDIDLAISTYLEAMEEDKKKTLEVLSGKFEDEVKQVVENLVSSSETSSNNIQIVAAAAEQLSASIQEISSQVSYTSKSAQETAVIVEETNTQVKQLNESAVKIGEIVDIINEIAEQTNLLALNATIEASRAGDSGRGFAVVALEVKSLAGKTAEATKEIIKQVEEIQSETRRTVDGISSIVSRISDVQARSKSVAEAIGHQQLATTEISRSVSQVSEGTKEATEQTRQLKNKVDGFVEQFTGSKE